MKYIFVIFFIITYILFGNELGYTHTSPFYTHFTYMFQHAGISHLVMNSIVFISMFYRIQENVNQWLLSGILIIASFIASFLSIYDIPTVGASSMIYVMIGMFFSFVVLSDTIKDKKKYFTSTLVVFSALLISAFKHNSNFWLHVFSLLIGLIVETIITICKEGEFFKKYK